MGLPKRLTSLVCIFFLFTSVPALAVENLKIVVDQVPVYSAPSITSPVITVLKKGQVVLSGVNPGGGFKKVLVTDAGGKRVIGYVVLADLKPPAFPVAQRPGAKNRKGKKEKTRTSGLGLRRHFGVGVNIGINYLYQSSRTITDMAGDSASVSGLSGTNVEFGLHVAMPLNPKLSLGVDLNYKPESLTSTATANGTTQPSNIVDAITYAGLGVTGKFYADENSDWWYGPGVEYDYPMSGTLQIGSRPQYTFQSSEMTGYIFAFAATGYDFMSSKNFYFTPSFRLGAIVNGSPLIYEFDFVISGIYRF